MESKRLERSPGFFSDQILQHRHIMTFFPSTVLAESAGSGFYLNSLVYFLAGSGLGGTLVWIICREYFRRKMVEWKTERRIREAKLQSELAQEKAVHEEKVRTFEAAQNQLTSSFKVLSVDALRSSQETFIAMAKETLAKEREIDKGDMDRRRKEIGDIVSPVRESLSKVDQRIKEIERAREGAYQALKHQVATMAETQENLHQETGNLVRALRRPVGRGQWGELQLRRVVEMAGMQEYCDFDTQKTKTGDEGQRLRPDLIVNLPGGKNIVVDSKTPMDAYLDAIEAREKGDDKTAKLALERHATQVRTHISQLAAKSYQNQFETSPEFVVLFLPSESFFSDALSQDPGLIERGVDEGVILATPTTLIALLRAVAYGWRQETLAKNAQIISQLGNELYDRLAKMGEHFGKMGRSLTQTVNNYNSTVGALESRVLVSARRFRELGAAPERAEDLEAPGQVETLARNLQADEMRPKASDSKNGSSPRKTKESEKPKKKPSKKVARPKAKSKQEDDQSLLF